MRCSVFGAGAWGTAMAIHMARLGHATTLVPRRHEHAETLKADKENKDYLPRFSFPDTLNVTADVPQALENTELVFLACPSHALRNLCENIKAHLPQNHSIKIFISLCKGLERESLLLPCSVIEDVIPNALNGSLSGPSFAHEVAAGQPTAIVLATRVSSPQILEIQENLSNHQFRVYSSTDLSGTEYASCLKNVYAIGAGICDGLKLGDNAKAAYLTRALHELIKLGTELGGQTTTFYGLSGFGDLILTCFGKASRNRTFGQMIAQGTSPKTIVNKQHTVIEGYYATASFHQLVQKKEVRAPIMDELFSVLYNEKKPQQALKDLMSRDLKPEI